MTSQTQTEDTDTKHVHYIYIIYQRAYEFGNVGMIQQVLRGLFYMISQFGRTIMLSCVFVLFLCYVICVLFSFPFFLLGGGVGQACCFFECPKNPDPEFLGIPE